MSEPDVEAVIAAGRRRGRPPKSATPDASVASQDAAQTVDQVPAPIQPVSLTSRPEPVVPASDDPRIVNLVASGMTEEAAMKLVADLQRMW